MDERSRNYQTLRNLWLAEAARPPERVGVLKNATYLLQQHDRPTAVKLMRRAYEITKGGDENVTGYFGVQLGLLWVNPQDGESGRPAIEGELAQSTDSALIGSAGRTILQYSNPNSTSVPYARALLQRAIALSPTGRLSGVWQRDLERLNSGLGNGTLRVPEPTNLRNSLAAWNL